MIDKAVARDNANPRSRRGGYFVFILVIVACVVSFLGWRQMRVDSSLEPLLPEHSSARQTILFFRDSSFAAKAVLWFRLKGEEGSVADLVAAANKVESKLDPTLVKRVLNPPREADAMDEMLDLLDHAGELLSEKDLAELDAATSPVALKKRMREIYVQLVKPEGAFMQQIIRRDPLGVTSRVLARLYALSSGLGFKVEVKNGHFVHPDGRQLILVVETSASAQNLSRSHDLVDHFGALAADLPENITMTPICAQVHTAQNDTVMRRDVNVAGTLDAIGFLLLFALVCRDWRVGAVFILPVIAIAVAIGWSAWVYPKISIMVMGLTATMAGSAVDYGIFVYTAYRSGSQHHTSVVRIAKHLLLSLCTTAGVFIAFLFSDVPAYRQLGCLTTVSLVVAMLGAMFVLPKAIRSSGGRITTLPPGPELHTWGRKMRPLTWVTLALLLVGCGFAAKVSFNPDVNRLDGVEPGVKAAERDFQKTWARGGTDQAIIVVTASTVDEVERVNDEMYQLLSDKFGPNGYSSLASFWPSSQTRVANEARWKAFWSPAKVEQVKQDLTTAAEPFGFTEKAFEPFFATVLQQSAKSQSREVIASVEEQFIAHKDNGDWQMLNYIADTEENVVTAQKLIAGQKNVQLISRRGLSKAFAESAVAETRLLIGISVAFIVVSLLVLTRSIKKSILIMVPAVAGVIAMIAMLTITNQPMSVVTVIAAIMVMALSSDYGIFAVYAWEDGETLFGQGMTAAHLSSITTLIATGSLLLAKHPALFMVGATLTTGLSVGYLAAVLVVPGIYAILNRRQPTLVTPEAA